MARCCLLACVLVACAADHDAGEVTPGRYEVIEHLGSRCAIDQPVTMPVPFVEIDAGDPGVVLGLCNATDTCATANLSTEIAGGWSGGIGSAQTYENGRICALGYRLYEVTASGSALVVHITSHGIAGGPGSCTVDDAVARGTSMPCVTHERIEATR